MKSGIFPDKLKNFTSSPLPDAWQEVREFFGHENNLKALELIEALRASHRIYMFYAEGRYHDNNHFRSQLMKKYFYSALKNVRNNFPEARFFIKLGGNHISRGHSVLGIQDIGNFISELAVLEDSRSFHLFVVPISWAQNIWLPFLPESYKDHPLDGDYGAGAAHLLANAPYQDGLNLYDLRPLRNRQTALSKGEPQFK